MDSLGMEAHSRLTKEIKGKQHFNPWHHLGGGGLIVTGAWILQGTWHKCGKEECDFPVCRSKFNQFSRGTNKKCEVVIIR